MLAQYIALKTQSNTLNEFGRLGGGRDLSYNSTRKKSGLLDLVHKGDRAEIIHRTPLSVLYLNICKLYKICWWVPGSDSRLTLKRIWAFPEMGKRPGKVPQSRLPFLSFLNQLRASLSNRLAASHQPERWRHWWSGHVSKLWKSHSAFNYNIHVLSREEGGRRENLITTFLRGNFNSS